MTTAPPDLEKVVLEKPIMGDMLNHRLRLGDDQCCLRLRELGTGGDLPGDFVKLLFPEKADALATGQVRDLAGAFIRRWPEFHLRVIREALLQAYRCPEDPDPLPLPDPMPVHFGARIQPGCDPEVTITLKLNAIDILFTGPGTLKGLPPKP
jgi:hypothetical protein